LVQRRFSAFAVAVLALAVSGSIGAAQTEIPPSEVVNGTESDAAAVERGGGLVDEGKYEEAIRLFNAILSRSPNNGGAVANRAVAYAWTNRLEEAERDLHAAEAVMPGAAVLYRIRALLADRRSDDETLIVELTKSLAIEPGDPMALAFRANAYQRAKRELDAMADADALVAARRDDPNAYAFRAELAVRQLKRQFAIEEAERLKTLFPDNAGAMAAAAQIFNRLGQRDKALERIDEAIRIEPDYYDYYHMRAGMRKWDDLERRQADLEMALALDPGNAGTFTQLGLVAFKRGRWVEAIGYFTRILETEPRDFGLLAYRGMAHHRAGDDKAAKSDLDTAMAMTSGPDDFDLICLSLAREGEFLESALIACDKAIASKNSSNEYRADRGLVRLRLGQLPAALEDYDAAVAADDRIAANFYGRALARQRAGDLAGSKADRERALAIDPTVAEDFEQWGLALTQDSN
jgi:tetratricopeptide (TPR) repeat protein